MKQGCAICKSRGKERLYEFPSYEKLFGLPSSFMHVDCLNKERRKRKRINRQRGLSEREQGK